MGSIHLFGVTWEYPLPLPLGEVAERSEDGEGKQSPYHASYMDIRNGAYRYRYAPLTVL